MNLKELLFLAVCAGGYLACGGGKTDVADVLEAAPRVEMSGAVAPVATPTDSLTATAYRPVPVDGALGGLQGM